MTERGGGVGAALLEGFGWLMRRLPRRALYAAGRGVGLSIYLISRRRRLLARANLAQAFGGEMDARARERLSRASFAHLGTNAVEFFLLPGLGREDFDRLMSWEGEEHLRQALAGGKGALLLTGHLGNYDLLAAALARRGYPISLISKVSRNRAVNAVWMGYRARSGVKIFFGRNTLRGILGHLREGGMVGVVLDQNALRRDGVFVPFFGREASTLAFLSVLAARTGAPVIPISTWREGTRHRVLVEPPLEVPEAPAGDAGTVARTAAYTRWTEAAIRRHPEQWTWLHNRWRTRPPGEGKRPSLPQAGRRPAVFLDRDGTLLDELGYLGDPERMSVFPFAGEAVRLLNRAGFLVVIVTNQSGVGRGLYPEEGAQAVNLALLQRLQGEGGRVDAAYFCPHLPDAGCACRKPAPGMALRAEADLSLDLSRSWVVGDMDKDILLASSLGMRGALVETGHAVKGEVPPGTPRFPTLLEAAREIARDAEAGR